MKRKILDLKVAPRWLVQLFDAIIVCISFVLSYFVVKHFEFAEISRGHFFIYTGAYVLTTAFVFYCMGIHKGMIRYSNIMDVTRVFIGVLVSGIVYVLFAKPLLENVYNFHSLEGRKVLFVNFFVSTSILVIIRAAVRETFHFARRSAAGRQENVLIYGDTKESILIKNGVENADKLLFHVKGFIVAKKQRKNNHIEQIRLFHLDDLAKLKAKYKIDKLIISHSAFSSDEKRLVIEECLKSGLKMVSVAPPEQWVYGKLNAHQLRDIRIEDVLQRDPIRINNAKIKDEISGKRVLVTGAAGSIGSELVRQLLQYTPSMIILCDQAETALHDLHIALDEEFPHKSVRLFPGNVQNVNRMRKLFEEHRPQVVFHAAAYKHVPLMEEHPSEAVLANVLGTKNMAELSILFKVEKFVMVSTDKAVNPSNVMGASKRIAEMFVQSLDEVRGARKSARSNVMEDVIRQSSTKFITTRFGNVLGSQGSVLPRFQSQIEKGGPVTVTHPDIIRYFMTIPEAVQLVLEAATMGSGGEIYVFDMGKPVRILDLATQMIKLAGYIPDQDIKIEFTGLRPGEKLYEELLSDEEVTSPTHHEKIKIARVGSRTFSNILPQVEELIRLSQYEDDMQIAAKMKQLVPEFISRNSAYEYLDYVNKIKVISDAQILGENELVSISPTPDISSRTKTSLSA